MKSTNQPSQFRQLQLSHEQSKHVASVLGRVIQRTRGSRDSDRLQSLSDQIDDEVWLGQWARDLVKIEISIEEQLAVEQALTITVAEDDLSTGESLACENLLRQLSSADFELASAQSATLVRPENQCRRTRDGSHRLTHVEIGVQR